MGAKMIWTSGYNAGSEHCLETLPAPSVQACGIGGSGHGQYELLDDGKETKPMVNHPNKPPYRVPLMAEILRSMTHGRKVATTFAGGGGSSTGYEMAGFEVVWANEFLPEAQDTYRANHPRTVLDPRDIKLIKPEEILAATGLAVGELDVFDGSPPCFAAGTPVTTFRGVIPIEQVAVGDMVLTHECRWRRVVNTMVRKANTVMVGGRVETTADHRFLAREQVRLKNHKWLLREPGWVPAESIHKQFCASPVAVQEAPLPEPPKGYVYGDGFWYFVGRWLGDGWLRIKDDPNRRRADVLICTGETDAGALREAVRAVAINFHESPPCRSAVRFTISSRPLATWLLQWFGRLASGKTVPGWALGMKESWRAMLFRGYDDADGCGHQATTVSRNLAVGVALLATGLGMTVGICGPHTNKRGMVEGRKVNARPQWCVRYKQDDGRYTRIAGLLRWKKIRKPVVPARRSVTVYDIEVEEDHSFVADIFVVHNCQAFSTAGQREAGWGKAKRYSNGVEQCNELLFYEYIRLLGGLAPRCFIAENVKGLTIGAAKSMMGDHQLDMLDSQDDTILHGLMNAGPGYVVRWQVLDAARLGVPQTRNRVIFVGVRKDIARARGLEPCFPAPLPWTYTVRDALPELFGRVACGNHRFEPKFGEPEAGPSPTITASGARTSGLVEERVRIEGANGFDGHAPKSVDAPAPAILAGRPVDLIITQQQGGGFGERREVSPDRPVPAVCASQHSQFVLTNRARGDEPVRPVDPDAPAPTVTSNRNRKDMQFDLKTTIEIGNGKHNKVELTGDGLRAVHHTAGQFSAGDVTDKPAPAVTLAEQMFVVDAGSVRTDPATGANLELDHSRRKVCDGTQAFGSAGAAATADQPSPPVLTPPNSVVSKEHRRKFTIAELRRICAFPDDYVLTGSYGQQWARCGNSVPPVMMFHIASALRDGVLARIAPLEWRARAPLPEGWVHGAAAPVKAKEDAAPAKPKRAKKKRSAAAEAPVQADPAGTAAPEGECGTIISGGKLCAACKGSGKSSAGGVCLPCKGTGYAWKLGEEPVPAGADPGKPIGATVAGAEPGPDRPALKPKPESKPKRDITTVEMDPKWASWRPVA